MGDFELDLFLDLGRHVPMRFIHILRCPVEEIKIDNHTLRGVVRYQPARREAGEVSLSPSRARKMFRSDAEFAATLLAGCR
jgi:hypothetical protein